MARGRPRSATRSRATVASWAHGLRAAASSAASRGARSPCTRRSLAADWHAFVSDDDCYAPLLAAKHEAALRLLARGARRARRLAGAAPPARAAGVPAAVPRGSRASRSTRSTGVADAIGIKLYTMHWPMIARYWARDLVGRRIAAAHDAVTAAVAQRCSASSTAS